MKKIIGLLVGLLAAFPAWSATVYLNNGKEVSGRIVEKSANSIKLDVSGVVLTYYSDEYSRVDEQEAPAAPVAAAPVPAAPRPAVSTPEPVSSWQPALPAGTAADKRQLILKFIEVYGTRETMRANLAQMISSLPAEQSAAFNRAFSVDEIIELLLPLYDKYFSEEDLQASIGFFTSPAGRKLVESIPNIMRESVAVSAKYFEEKMPEELKNVPPPQAGGM